jgi:hypothetical protein
MFLRFISPAIVSPESIDIELPKENESTMRRGLMVVAKVIQNLANNMFFGKQAHMAPLNDFLKNNIVVVTRFLSELNVCTTFSSLPLDIFERPTRNTTREENHRTWRSGLVSLTMIQNQSSCTDFSTNTQTRSERSSSAFLGPLKPTPQRLTGRKHGMAFVLRWLISTVPSRCHSRQDATAPHLRDTWSL